MYGDACFRTYFPGRVGHYRERTGRQGNQEFPHKINKNTEENGMFNNTKKGTQGEKEEENKKANVQYDEGVLNPEYKNEADLSMKERRILEKEKLKGMGLKKKLEYIWMYYKVAIFGFIGILLAIYIGVDLYQNAQIETVLSISVVNAGLSEFEPVEAEIKEQLGYDPDDKYSEVSIITNLSTDSTGEKLDYNAQMAYMAQLQAQNIDVMVMPESLRQDIEDDEVFADLSEVLGEEICAAFGENFHENYITITDSQIIESIGVSYEPVCIAVMVNSLHQENAAKWIASLY